MHIDRYRNADGDGYTTPDGCYHENAESVLRDTLGFCGCGCPKDALVYARDTLRHIDALKTLDLKDRAAYVTWKAAGLALHGSEGACYFAWYVLAEKDLTEHGSSVPGWLSQTGRELLEDLNEHLALSPTP